MGGRRTYDDDDGRTIVDMTGVDIGPRWLPRRPEGGGHGSGPASGSGQSRPEPRHEAPGEGGRGKKRPWEQEGLSRGERRLYVFGALRAGLLIALAYIVGLGALVGLMVLVWK